MSCKENSEETIKGSSQIIKWSSQIWQLDWIWNQQSTDITCEKQLVGNKRNEKLMGTEAKRQKDGIYVNYAQQWTIMADDDQTQINCFKRISRYIELEMICKEQEGMFLWQMQRTLSRGRFENQNEEDEDNSIDS